MINHIYTVDFFPNLLAFKTAQMSKARPKLNCCMSEISGVSTVIIMSVFTVYTYRRFHGFVFIKLYRENPLSQSALDTGRIRHTLVSLHTFGYATSKFLLVNTLSAMALNFTDLNSSNMLKRNKLHSASKLLSSIVSGDAPLP